MILSKTYRNILASILIITIANLTLNLISTPRNVDIPFLELTELVVEIETDQEKYSLHDNIFVEVYALNNRTYDVKLLPISTIDFNIVYLNDTDAVKTIKHFDYFVTDAREKGSIPIQAGQRVLLGTKSFRIREAGIIRINYLDKIKDIEIFEEP